METDAASFKLEVPPPSRPRSSSISQRIRRTTNEDFYETLTGLEFKETPAQTKDEFEYKRSGSDPGLLIVININQFDFDPKLKRHGSEKDMRDLIKTFGKIGFNVKKKYILENLSKPKIQSALKEVAEMDLSEYNCLVLIFMSHGDTGNKVLVTDGEMDASEFWTPFERCKTLIGKPKLFMFQACKGKAKTIKDEGTEFVPKCTFQESLPKDMLVLYSSIEGKASIRDTEEGSWLMQQLCQNILMYAQTEDVASILTRTAKCVSLKYHYDDNDYWKQMPVFLSTLTKQFYFTRSRAREYNLHLEKLVSDMNKDLKGILAKLNTQPLT